MKQQLFIYFTFLLVLISCSQKGKENIDSSDLKKPIKEIEKEVIQKQYIENDNLFISQNEI